MSAEKRSFLIENMTKSMIELSNGDLTLILGSSLDAAMFDEPDILGTSVKVAKDRDGNEDKKGAIRNPQVRIDADQLEVLKGSRMFRRYFSSKPARIRVTGY